MSALPDETVTGPEMPLAGYHRYPPDKQGRTRYVRLSWPRDPEGQILQKPGPAGKRPPNGIIWGHTLDEFFSIDRLPDPNVGVVTIWSRSMLKVFGENYYESQWKYTDRDSVPHKRKPWPVLKLKLPKGEVLSDYILSEDILDFGQIFPGCPVGRWQVWPLRNDDPDEDMVMGHAADLVAAGNPGDISQDSIIEEPLFPDNFFKNGNGNSPYKRQGRTIELRAYQPSYDYKPYNMPAALSAARDSPFSTEDIPKLEESIPDMYFPDYLLVHDPHDVLLGNGQNKTDNKLPSKLPPPRRYKRARPGISKQKQDEASKLEAWKGRETVAHLYLHQNNRFGVGHHSLVYRAPLELPPPLSARSRNGRVTVAAKIAMLGGSERAMLENEAKIYDEMPKHMFEDWCGYNLVTPVPHPVPVGPVLPKFYGYYEPVKNAQYRDRSSPILLLEECGEPIEPHKLTLDQKTECFSLMFRLHLENVVQNSYYVRNILRQPGPLYVAPEERSKDTPSFRVIDFGRASVHPPRSPSDHQYYDTGIDAMFRAEEALAREQLGIEKFRF